LRVNGPARSQSQDPSRRGKRSSIRKIDGYGMGEMANTAMLVIIRLGVPMAGCLERK